ncbi:GntR family transcriptional regulator/MocR family aminotransferase [Pseudonocardia sediminis]|uniref:GntR family transcriptional regulator/MocR family aminotransferase n=1 Tax=Pseudonocardia sediminis TaxID=1397368 RepID=A0A4Q7UWZ4_PSEST|nr:PLP-dependent aminotransferase family protein [Pseudonocardia sediminis]RZT84629.1 GntR family transcriptional regulator/MocR family aminotransferase [Pseudonocardia sediminis]
MVVADVPPVLLDRGSPVALAVQLADGLRDAAVRGALRPGDRLPSTRALAVELGVSRTVTAAAYEQLLAEGWVHGRVGAGTFVTGRPGAPPGDHDGAPVLCTPPRVHPGPAATGTVGGSASDASWTRNGAVDAMTRHSASATTRHLAPPPPGTGTPTGATASVGDAPRLRAGAGTAVARHSTVGGGPGLLSLAPGTPCVDVLDRAAWRRAWRAAADPAPDDAPRPDGVPAFRAVVAEHLLRHRGLTADPDDVLATAGSSAAIAELARLFPAGSRVAVEEPGYVRAVTALRAAGVEVVGVPVDEEGMVVDALPTGCAAVYCTPAHQFPLGSRLTASRRVALLERARAERMLVIEDDYDGELRYDVGPLPLLAALAPEVVVHLGTASKIVSQTLGAGWLVAPPDVRDALRDLRARTGTRPSPAGQRVFAAFAAQGDLARHLRRLRRELGTRRDLVRDAVAVTGWTVTGEAAGAHVVLTPPGSSGRGTEDGVVAGARSLGVEVHGLARYHHAGPPTGDGVVVGYAAHTRADLTTALTHLATVLTRSEP